MLRESRVTESSEAVALNLYNGMHGRPRPQVKLVSRAVTWLQRAYLTAVTGWHVGSGGEPFAVGSVSGDRRRGFCVSQAPRTPRCQTSHLGDIPEASGFPRLSTVTTCLLSI